MYPHGTIANSQKTPTKINCQNKNFSGTSDTIRHLKTFRVISNEILVLLVILCWWYFRYIQTSFLMFILSWANFFVTKREQVSFFEK